MKYAFTETIERMKKEIERLFEITEEDLVCRKLFIEIKKPTKPEDIIIKNDYKEDECHGIPDGKKYVSFYFCDSNEESFSLTKDEGIHINFYDDNYVVDRYSNNNIDLETKVFIVLYEDYSSNSNGDYLVEIYPLIA